MSLLSNRQVFETANDFVGSGIMERGGIVCHIPGSTNAVTYLNAAALSGSVAKPVGMLLIDFEAINPMKQEQYVSRDAVRSGQPAGIASEGEFWTDKYETTLPSGGSVGTYATGDFIYLANNGQVSRNSIGGLRPTIGKVLLAPVNGFIKISVEV